MVKCHKRTGQPRHFRKNQSKHQGFGFSRGCGTCAHVGRGSGNRYRSGVCMGNVCFNKRSKFYMQLVRVSQTCPLYEMEGNG